MINVVSCVIDHEDLDGVLFRSAILKDVWGE